MLIKNLSIGNLCIFHFESTIRDSKRCLYLGDSEFFVVNTKKHLDSLLVKVSDYPTWLNYDSYLDFSTAFTKDPNQRIADTSVLGNILQPTLKELLKRLEITMRLPMKKAKQISKRLKSIVESES